MPRKFLGERIDPSTDAIRPASMTLTAEDLSHIPSFHFDDESLSSKDDLILNNPKRGKRLSRKFGGTMKLKQRLESVPEIFMHDFKKKSQSNRERISLPPDTTHSNIPNTNKNNNRSIDRSRIQSENRPRNLQERRVLQRRISSKNLPNLPEEDEDRKSIIIPYPSTLNSSFVGSVMATAGKSDSEILFDEIIACYGLNNNTIGMSSTNAFNQELERVLDHVTKIDNINKMNNEFLPEKFNHLTLPTKKIIPTTPTLNSIDAQLATPEYSDANQSSPWSSLGDEYSVSASSQSSTDDTHSSYSTTKDELNSLADLSITKIPSSISDNSAKDIKLPAVPELPVMYSRKNKFLKRPNYVKPVGLKKINLSPVIATIAYSDDEEKEEDDDYVISPQIERRPAIKLHTRVNTIRDLQQKIDHISLAKQNTVLSASSSVYSSR